VGRDGEYRGSFTPEMDGPYTVEVEAVVPPRPGSTQVTMAGTASADEGVGRTRVTSTRYLDVGPSPAEYFGASMNAALLRRVAEETGGRFYTPETAATLPEDITYTGAGVTLVEENELWDMPILFLLLVGLLGGEWIYRRRRSLA